MPYQGNIPYLEQEFKEPKRPKEVKEPKRPKEDKEPKDPKTEEIPTTNKPEDPKTRWPEEFHSCGVCVWGQFLLWEDSKIATACVCVCTCVVCVCVFNFCCEKTQRLLVWCVCVSVQFLCYFGAIFKSIVLLRPYRGRTSSSSSYSHHFLLLYLSLHLYFCSHPNQIRVRGLPNLGGDSTKVK